MLKRAAILLSVILIGLSGCGLEAGQDDSVSVISEGTAEEYTIDRLPFDQGEDDGTLAAFQDENGLWGFLSKDGEVKIEPRFLSVGGFSEGVSWVEAEEGLFGYIDPSGAYVDYLHPSFSYASDFSGGAALVTDNGSDYFYINKTGGLFFPERIIDYGESYWEPFVNNFSYATLLKNGYALGIEKNPNADAYDAYVFSADGEAVLQLKPQWTENAMNSVILSAPDENGYCIVGEDAENKVLYGVVNLDQEEILPIEYEEILPFSEGLFAVKKDGLWGYVDAQNQIVITFEYFDARSFSDNVAPVKEQNGWVLINPQGARISESEYEDVSMQGFCEGLLAVKQNGKWGYVNTVGDVIVVPVLASAGDYRCGAALYENEEGKFGYIDAQGRIIIEACYEKAEPFCETE